MYIRNFEEVGINDVSLVGGKNASLGEMIQSLKPRGINFPEGFVVTAEAFDLLLEENNISERIFSKLDNLDIQDVAQLSKAGRDIRTLIKSKGLPDLIAQEIKLAYQSLCKKTGVEDLDVAVRSSATAEDLPEASFAGQQETFLNIRGTQEVLEASLNCFASLFTDRAISYRVSNKFDHRKVKLSIGIQQMVRSDSASSGVIFTLDTESGSRNVILLTSAYGLGENIVGGRVDPDEFLVLKETLGKANMPIIRRKLGSKQQRLIYARHGTRSTKNVEVSALDRSQYSLTDEEVITLAKWSRTIENYYSSIYKKDTPMDIEWAKDGLTGHLFILQARPETIHAPRSLQTVEVMTLQQRSKILLRGTAVGSKIGAGSVRIIRSSEELSDFKDGEILVTDMTDPDWEPVMKKASAIVTNRGGRTCHAAIVSREHGVPCIVGTGTATDTLSSEQKITVSCAEGETGLVMEGLLPYTKTKLDWTMSKKPQTKIMVNLANPDEAMKASIMPVDGVGLVRIEFIIAQNVKVHPMALIHDEEVKDKKVYEDIQNLIKDHKKYPGQYFVENLAEGIGRIAGAFYPRPVIVRLSDFKTNEYAHLLGGEYFEPLEENPMIGFRGASRYYDTRYREGFSLECKAIKYVREEMGLTNVKVMVPFCRTAKEGTRVVDEMKKNGLVQNQNGLEVYVMCELPSNVLDVDAFAKVFDGFSIGSNDLTQMTLGVDRDSEIVDRLFNERDPAVLKIFQMAIDGAIENGKPIGICGQAPSDYPEMAKYLVACGINSISLTPDSVFKTIPIILEAEKLAKRDFPEDDIYQDMSL